MKAYEFLILTKSYMVRMIRNGLDLNDIAYIDICRDYWQMKEEGCKDTAIWCELSKRYKIQASTLRNVVRRLNEEIKL